MQAAAVRKEPQEVKHLSMEEARMKVQGAIRDWVLESVGEKMAAEPG